MSEIWCLTHQGGRPTYHESELAAESAARRLVAAQPGVKAVIYRLDIEGESA